ncbi:MAG: hypothetical protein JEY97_06535 [Bacteroidales bacterium]|nr:hypothetical protein [Bacteroidales bacterium]
MKKECFFAILIFFIGSLVFQSCKREGCTNPKAENYDLKAKTDDGSCVICGCTNPNAINYDSEATNDDGSCIIYGCTNPDADNYNPDATTDDGSCIIKGCTNPDAENYNPDATEDDGSCIIYGCTDPNALNYNPEATDDDGSCTYNDPKGEGVFWVDTDYGIGTISVYVEGTFEGKITSFYSTGTPDCGASGCVTIERDPGSYSFYAESQLGIYWNGSITISSGGCKRMRLYITKEGKSSISINEEVVNSFVTPFEEIMKPI